MADEIRKLELDADIQVRNESQREIDVRLMPWGSTIESFSGPETFARGAFDDTDPKDVRLWGVEHEVHFGVGQDGSPRVTRHPAGKAIRLENRDDGEYATFKVARTSAGDDVLALAADGLASGVSIEFAEVPGGTTITRSGNRRAKVHNKVRLTGASTTYQPAYAGAEVLQVRSKGETEVTETAAVEAPAFDPAALAAAIGESVGNRLDAAISAVQTRSDVEERMSKLEEQARSAIVIPGSPDKGKPKWNLGEWAQLVTRVMGGETVKSEEIQARVAADLITDDNLGVIPAAYLNDIIGIIDPARPFLQTTRRVNVPSAGMQLSVPKIVTRPTVGVQTDEKDELTSTPTSIVPATFDAVTVGGYGDISLQLLKRSDPSFLELYIELLAEALAQKADDLAVDALLAASGVHAGGAVDPDDGPLFGDAWANAAAVSRRLTPDTIWMNSSAVAAFINAKSTTTNAPLYGNLAGAFSAAAGTGGTISGLRPVYVPALNDEAVDIIVGPSRGFVWTEDGAYQLQADNPGQAGRDVALVSMYWFAPYYPLAFTTYTVAS